MIAPLPGIKWSLRCETGEKEKNGKKGMVKLVENTEETVHAKKLLDELRSEVREALSGFEQIGDDELYDCIEQAVAGVAERQYLPLGQRIDLKNRLLTASGDWISCRNWWMIRR